MEELVQTAVLAHSSSVSIQWDFPAVWAGLEKFLISSEQLKSFVHLRINLSPFTKDFRVRETPIENLNYLSSFLWGSNHNSRSCWERVHSWLFGSKSHADTMRREASPNLSKSIFPPNYWHRLKSSTKTKMGNFAKEFWSQNVKIKYTYLHMSIYEILHTG